MTNISLQFPVRQPINITQVFGAQDIDYSRFGLLAHNGVDFAYPYGSDVLASAAGVAYPGAYDAQGYGYFVDIFHGLIDKSHPLGEFYTRYAHLSEICVKNGTSVKPGDVIGHSGSTGYSTGPHLHWELRIPQGTRYNPVDPVVYVQALEPALDATPSLDELTLLPSLEWILVDAVAGLNCRLVPSIVANVPIGVLPNGTRLIKACEFRDWTGVLLWVYSAFTAPES